MLTADAEYGSEENYEYLKEKAIETFVKYNTFDNEQGATNSKKSKDLKKDELFYNEKEDFYVCTIGQGMNKTGEHTSKTKSGYKQVISTYQTQNCEGCPLRGSCHNGKYNRIIQRNKALEEHKSRIRKSLLSDIREYYRKKRSIDVEPVFH